MKCENASGSPTKRVLISSLWAHVRSNGCARSFIVTTFAANPMLDSALLITERSDGSSVLVKTTISIAATGNAARVLATSARYPIRASMKWKVIAARIRVWCGSNAQASFIMHAPQPTSSRARLGSPTKPSTPQQRFDNHTFGARQRGAHEQKLEGDAAKKEIR